MSYNGGMEGVIGVLIGFGLVVVLPIVAILTQHQRKMAEILHSRQQQEGNPEIAALRHEIRELKELIHQQAIALDTATGRVRPPMPPTSDLRERILG